MLTVLVSLRPPGPRPAPRSLNSLETRVLMGEQLGVRGPGAAAADGKPAAEPAPAPGT